MLQKDGSFVQYPEIVLIKASHLFDRNWYLAQYEDAALSGLEPEQHYLQVGAKKGYDPSTKFCTDDYLFLYADVYPMNPLVHYEILGKTEGRKTRIEQPLTGKAPNLGKKIKIFFISGEPETPGHTYRISRYAAAAKSMDADVVEFNVKSAYENLGQIADANLIFVWRATWSEQLSAIFSLAKKSNIPIVFDIDDLLIDPNLAKIHIVDGIRTTNSTENAAKSFFELLQTSMQKADYCSAPTSFLSNYLCSFAKKTFQLPNGFDEQTWQASRLALRTKLKSQDGILRIGYAGGSRTHQKDFAKVANVLADILRERPNCRLVLFRKGDLACTDIQEFPALMALSHQIEWRELVPLEELPLEMARFDVNLAPLETGNAFCEAKSELKFFESALVEVPVVASPTLTFKEAILDGKTGFLATDEKSWYEILSKLLDDVNLRQQIGRNAYYSVIWRYGHERRMELLTFMLDIIFHRGLRAAQAFELNLLKTKKTFSTVPVIAAHEIIICDDKLKTAEITAVLPCQNAGYALLDQLESIKQQTLLNMDLIIVDDCSTDNSLEIAKQWLNKYKERFNRIMLIRNNSRSGLGLTKNVGFSHAETLFILMLHQEQKLLPNFASNCLAKIKESGAAFVYANFYASNSRECIKSSYDPSLFSQRNFVGGTALIRLAAWAHIGGYAELDLDADYDFWCKSVEHGLYGYHVEEILAMALENNPKNANEDDNQATFRENIHERHPWIWAKILREDLNANATTRR